MKLAILSTILFLGLGPKAFAFDYDLRTRHGMNLKLQSNEPLTTQTSRLLICSDNKKFRIRQLSIVSLSYKNVSSSPVTMAYTNQGCFLIGNVKFSKSGLWEIGIWDQNGEKFAIPALVSSNHYALYDELRRPAVQVWVPRLGKGRSGEAWLFCGKRQVNDVFLYHPASGKKIYRRHLSDFNDQCRIFSKLPLPEKGEWRLITILDNGDKVSGKVLYH